MGAQFRLFELDYIQLFSSFCVFLKVNTYCNCNNAFQMGDFPMRFGFVIPLNQKSHVFVFGNSKKPWSCRDDYSIIAFRVLIKQYLGLHVILKFSDFSFLKQPRISNLQLCFSISLTASQFPLLFYSPISGASNYRQWNICSHSLVFLCLPRVILCNCSISAFLTQPVLPACVRFYLTFM